MSISYFLISPKNYTFNMFLSRLPENIPWHDLGDGRYHIQSSSRGCWLERWNYWENCFSTLEDAFTKEQMQVINSVPERIFFTLSGGNENVLKPVMEFIANDSSIYISNDTDDPLIRGDFFVASINKFLFPRENAPYGL